jgi:hypothetical protein
MNAIALYQSVLCCSLEGFRQIHQIKQNNPTTTTTKQSNKKQKLKQNNPQPAKKKKKPSQIKQPCTREILQLPFLSPLLVSR